MLSHNPAYVDSLDFMTAAKVINRIVEKDAEKRLWEVWLTRYPNMTKENFESFSDFKERSFQKAVEIKYPKSTNEIMAEVQRIRKGKVVGTHGDI